MAKDFTIKVDAKDVIRNLRQLSAKDAPFLTAYALTKTGQDIKAAEIREMKLVFDQATPYTLNALQLAPATKTNLQAVVGYKGFAGKGTPAERFLGPQVDGGDRRKKGHERALERAGILRSDEYAVPALGAKLDAYGNMNRGQLVQMLSQLQASRDATQNMTDRSRKRSLKRAGGRFIVSRPEAGDPQSKVYGRAAAGIYLRTDGRSLMPILRFVKKPQYQKRFPFYEVGQRVFDNRFIVWAREGFDRFVASKLKKVA